MKQGESFQGHQTASLPYVVRMDYNRNGLQNINPPSPHPPPSTHTKTSRKHAYIILTPIKPHFYIVKLGFTGVYIIFLISAQKKIVGTYQNFSSENFHFLVVKISVYLNRCVFIMNGVKYSGPDHLISAS